MQNRNSHCAHEHFAHWFTWPSDDGSEIPVPSGIRMARKVVDGLWYDRKYAARPVTVYLQAISARAAKVSQAALRPT